MGMSPVNMNFMQSQGASAVPAFNFDASNLTAIAEQYGMPTSAFGDMSALGEGAQGLGEAPSLNFLDSLDSVVEKYSKSDASSSTPAAKQFTSMMTEYFKKFCPGMSEEQISALCNMYAEQYADLAKAMDMSSLVAGMNGASGASGASGVSGASNNGNYGANQGVDGLLADANAMVGMTETGNTSQINAITQKSGINCATTPWCAAWAMNMLKDHGVLDTSSCSNVNYCPTIVNWAKEQNIWAARGQYTPQAGDAILFDWDSDGTSDHIGIVEKVANGKVYTIEGNSSDSVKKNSYSLGSGSVMGYINCAAQ